MIAEEVVCVVVVVAVVEGKDVVATGTVAVVAGLAATATAVQAVKPPPWKAVATAVGLASWLFNKAVVVVAEEVATLKATVTPARRRWRRLAGATEVIVTLEAVTTLEAVLAMAAITSLKAAACAIPNVETTV